MLNHATNHIQSRCNTLPKKLLNLRDLILFFTTVLLIGCNNNELVFDSKKWKSDKIGHKNLRLKMVKDLVDSELLIGIKLDSVVELLGGEYYPQKSELNNKVSFTIKESYGFDIDPKYCSHLIIETDISTKRVLKVEYIETEDRRTLIEKIFTE